MIGMLLLNKSTESFKASGHELWTSQFRNMFYCSLSG